MSSISSLSRAVSALMTSQSALNSSAHNLSNVNTKGYVRQQVIMRDSAYQNVGQNATTTFSVGLGVDVQTIRQVRDQFLDQAYREEASRHGFYSARNNAVEEIEVIMGETEGESFSAVLNNLWASLNELSKHPDGLETRGTFVQNAALFVNRSNMIMNQLTEYQGKLNTEIIDSVNDINRIGQEIDTLNNIIVKNEVGGGNANDYRDQRNVLLDQLANMVDISYKEDKSGNILVKVENVDFVSLSGVNEIGLQEAAPFSTLVEPVWTHLNRTVFNYSMTNNPELNNDKGTLKGLLLARGSKQGNWTDMLNVATYEQNIKPSIIMNAQVQFDNLVHGIVTMINDVLSPNTTGVPPVLDVANAPYGLDGSQGIELFKREGIDRYDLANQFNIEDPANCNTIYTAGKLEINPDILIDYDKLCLSKVMGEDGDNSVVEDILAKWESAFSSLEPGLTAKLNYTEYYNEYISNIGNMGYSIENIMKNQELMVIQIDNKRNSLMGVSSDEELGNVIKYQHAYNAAAKVVSVVDEMIEQLVMNTGLVGR